MIQPIGKVKQETRKYNFLASIITSWNQGHSQIITQHHIIEP